MPLKLYKRGEVWWIRGAHLKQSVRRTTGTRDKEVAEAILSKTIASITSDVVYGAKATRTFGDAALSYMKSDGNPRFLGISPGKEPFGIYAKFCNSPLKSITQSDLDEAARTLYPQATPETRNRQCYTPFIAVWNHAVKNGWADVRQWQRPRKAKGTNIVRMRSTRVVRAGDRPTTYDKAAQFVAAMSPAPAMLMTALFYTGMRPIELFTLEASSVNVATRWIVLEHTKTGEPRGVPMHEFLAPMLAALLKRNSLAEDPRLFRTPRGEPYPVHEGVGGQLKTAISGARRRSGVTYISPYTARHTVSTQLVINGVHPHIKDQILGHAVDDMSRHYTNVPQQPLIDAINTLPVPQAWRDMPWIADPLAWAGKLAEGTGRRTDLEKRRDIG